MNCRFRPCIDLHDGKVKQIVGGSLKDSSPGPKENFVSNKPPAYFAELFHADHLTGGHVIKLGPGNETAAREALNTWPGGLQIGGGINLENASEWLHAGASHVIVTSALFDQDGHFLEKELAKFSTEIGADKLVVDLSCRRTTNGWTIAMNRWQTLTNLQISQETLHQLKGYCAEFLIHAADVEGLCAGVDEELIEFLGNWAGLPMTYAGGASSMEDVEKVDRLGKGKIDITVGSALDIFGGSGIRYADLAARSARFSI